MVLLFLARGSFNLNYFEEGYDKTIIEISKNEKDLFEIDEIASYTNSVEELRIWMQ